MIAGCLSARVMSGASRPYLPWPDRHASGHPNDYANALRSRISTSIDG